VRVNPASAPVAESERIGLLDFLRGVAILGILTVNVFSFGLPALGYFAPYAWGENTTADEIAFSVSVFLFQQKMYPLLAFLFGVGIYLIAEKEERGGRRSTGVYLRRMGLLVCMGLLHAVLLWHGDILVWYSCAGLVAYLMRHLSTRLLLIIAIFLTWGISLFCCGPLIGMMGAFPERTMPYLEVFQQHPANPSDAIQYIGRPYHVNYQYLSSHLMQSPNSTALEAHYYMDGSWLDLLPIRLRMYINTAFSAVKMFIPLLIGIMSFGILAGRFGVLAGAKTTASRRSKWVAVILGLLIGLPLCAVGLWLVWIKNPAALYGSMTLTMIGGPLVAGLYIVLLSAFYSSAVGKAFAYPVECVGRMALSNYIGQTIVFVTIFHNWGLGWFGELGYAQLSSLVVVSWLVQGILSMLWLRFFQFGPLEWFWRSATYLRFQPLLRR
jgi:uncharacterized protein